MNKKTFLPILPILLSIFFPLSGYAGPEQGPEERAVRIKGKEEILVARDIGRGAGIYPPRWCGGNAILFEGKNIGLELIDFITRERVRISEVRNSASLNCTPDGKWVLYVAAASTRYEVPMDVDIAEWQRYVADLYRYEAATGRREKIGVVRFAGPSWAWDAVSPDGSKVFLGARHNSAMEMPVPEWEALWFTNNWYQAGAVWFPDSSGVVISHHNPNRIGVEFFGNNGWAKLFVLGPEYKNNIYGLAVDEKNRILFLVREEEDPYVESKDLLYRCEIRDKDLACGKIFERPGFVSSYYAFLPDGDMIFQDSESECIQRISPGRADAECVVGTRYADKTYQRVALYGISPDGRWLVFKRADRITTPEGEFSHWQSDLFVIDLASE